MKMEYVGDNGLKSFDVNSPTELISYKHIGFSDWDIDIISNSISKLSVIYWSDTPPWIKENKISWCVDKERLIDYINKSC
ncbi:hypothetical protein F485_gp040 [Aeromonas phage CC2]|uniref:Uncharacterized protein n=1 Tax=Aeromonas phage CC2 TaxID=1204516 RepID=I6XKY4_9CAUD|nr:hypothetical protein F485_gp040 [Aeromonas phage CC2]AFN39159.1 hypothetical protein CC2_359 [Aeromonas phage CC2]